MLHPSAIPFDPIRDDIYGDPLENLKPNLSATLSTSVVDPLVQSSTRVFRKDFVNTEKELPKTKTKTFSGQLIPEMLRGPLATALSTCRQEHFSLSLMLVEIDRFEELVEAAWASEG